MLPPNRAAALLRAIHSQTVERCQWAALGLFLAFLPAGVAIWLVGLPGLLVSALLLGALTLRVMGLLAGIVAGGLARTELVAAAAGPRAWRIVGAE